MEDFEREVKVVVVGNGGVGKTSMIKRFCKGIFTDEYKKTIGVDFLEKQLYLPSIGQDVQLYLWDTAGQEEFDSITKTYYRGAGAAVLAFSTTDRASFDALPSWKAKVLEQCPGIAMVLVQNKVDMIDKAANNHCSTYTACKPYLPPGMAEMNGFRAAVTTEEAEAMARKLGLKFYRTCVKEDLNVTEVFTYLAELHDRKLSSGTLPQEVAMSVLEPGRTADAAAAVTSTSATDTSIAVGVTATIIGVAGRGVGYQCKHVASGVNSAVTDSDSTHACKALPASVELHPSVHRGKKKLTTTIKQRLTAQAKFNVCSIQ